MKKSFHIQLFIVMLTVGAMVQSGEVVAQKKLSTVVIDAGHGGKDPGALGKSCREKDIVLDVALRLGKMINDSLPEVKTIYTRDKDVFVDLHKRADIANKSGADLFISIHANWVKNPEIKGAETFVLGLHRSKENLEVAQKENSVITLEEDYTNNYEGFDPSQPESYIIFELMQNRFLENSLLMASKTQDEFVGLKRENRGVRQAGFLVLRQTSMPSVLVELGFLSNKEEELYMKSEEGKKAYVESIFRAFKNYKMQFDGANKVAVVKPEPTKPQIDNKGIKFKIQIITSSKKIDDLPKTFGEVEYREEDGKHKYMVYNTDTYDEISKLVSKVKKVYSDCFIVAYEDGKKVTTKYARKKTKK